MILKLVFPLIENWSLSLNRRYEVADSRNMFSCHVLG